MEMVAAVQLSERVGGQKPNKLTIENHLGVIPFESGSHQFNWTKTWEYWCVTTLVYKTTFVRSADQSSICCRQEGSISNLVSLLFGELDGRRHTKMRFSPKISIYSCMSSFVFKTIELEIT